MLNLLTIIGTRAATQSLTKPMKILNVIKNILTLVSILGICIAILFFVGAKDWPVNNDLGILFLIFSLIFIPTIQVIIKHFTTLNTKLDAKVIKKLRNKLIKKDYKLSVKANKKIEKLIATKGTQIEAKKQIKREKLRVKGLKTGSKVSKKSK